MSKEIFESLKLLERTSGIQADFMFEKIKKAIVTACKGNYDGNDDVEVKINQESNEFVVILKKTVVENVKFLGKEISLEDAKEIDKNAELNCKVDIKLETKDFGRIAVQTVRNMIRQGIKDGEKNLLKQEFTEKKGEIVTALIEKIDDEYGNLTLRIGKAEVVLPRNLQTGTEVLEEGKHIKVYITDVIDTDRGPKIMISRTSPEFVKKLFENEIPEINNGIVVIKSISREAGSRTKIAVYSNNEDVEAIGSCIGANSSRVNAILDELNGEKIDIIEYVENLEDFIAASLAPAKVLRIKDLNSEDHTCKALVPNNQISLAIGAKGQNVRLAAKLTNWKIDIIGENF
ncbi:MAG: transcription termination/antitermination protein NusA [Candidatus Paraimprobicoccus trichonymphae]|uniref:Transcription termination/antitermination protein NusA n=1 Tax=Candidatus Paraimprobicoccus trichonymphae TaxID=3033793 RepID=A0AA48HZD1_9FIRM|nr:MAG: transcription termination/antitermination protein NusA [Candidatus Paraimprobicoccus trichonymphae]